MERPDLVIIGAGQAGLASAHAARRAGLDAVVLEAAEQPGGSWPQHYDSLALFSPARYSELPGQPFPGDPDRYPTRDEIVAYLRDYAAQFEHAIRVGERVDTVDPEHDDGGFVTSTSGGLEIYSRLVIAATGAFHAPHRPALPGLESFAGNVLHSSRYRNPSGFENQRVVVVGAGNSAVQIAADLAPVANVTLATRRAIRWIDQRPLGRDLHWWYKATGFDTAPLGRWLTRLPDPVVDDGRYRSAIRAGKPDQRPMFKQLGPDHVRWSDDTREPLDALILATGYRAHFPFLEHTPALAPGGAPLHTGGVSTAVAGLGYVGLDLQRSFCSATVRGVARDAHHVLTKLTAVARPVSAPRPQRAAAEASDSSGSSARPRSVR